MTADRRPSRVPVRGSLALAITVGGLALLLGFRSPQDPGTELVLAMGTGDDPSTTPKRNWKAPPVAVSVVAVGRGVGWAVGSGLAEAMTAAATLSSELD
ncbi:MAG TPA: hypothetical protein VFF55_11480, partial [Candidatus Deferrimicrobium sp.]|nr:hypothetical protein [Candidatus Deferrimicrobium sp.]